MRLTREGEEGEENYLNLHPPDERWLWGTHKLNPTQSRDTRKRNSQTKSTESNPNQTHKPNPNQIKSNPQTKSCANPKTKSILGFGRCCAARTRQCWRRRTQEAVRQCCAVLRFLTGSAVLGERRRTRFWWNSADFDDSSLWRAHYQCSNYPNLAYLTWTPKQNSKLENLCVHPLSQLPNRTYTPTKPNKKKIARKSKSPEVDTETLIQTFH
jgi:hypothetical protein